MCAFNPRKLRKMLRSLDLSNLRLEEVPNVARVEFILKDGSRIVIDSPNVAKVSIGGLIVFQIQAQSGSIRQISSSEISIQAQSRQESLIVREEIKKAFTDEDVELVIQETGCSREEAIKALEETGGDIAEAIMLIKSRRGGS